MVKTARQRRAFLMQQMGGRCAFCGSSEFLEFDHMVPRRWVAAAKSRWQRQREYERDDALGELRLLCRSCNGRDGALRRWVKGVLDGVVDASVAAAI
jgi:5-methylcytosine-specific restriction endonuclease McrA